MLIKAPKENCFSGAKYLYDQAITQKENSHYNIYSNTTTIFFLHADKGYSFFNEKKEIIGSLSNPTFAKYEKDIVMELNLNDFKLPLPDIKKHKIYGFNNDHFYCNQIPLLVFRP